MPSQTVRIQYIDLAKGFCIILVVLAHMMAYYRTGFPYDYVLKCFRMPLYFFLSGVFFKQYENLEGFLKRKVNKLLIPFFSFYLVLSLALPWLLFHLCGVRLLCYHHLSITRAFLQFVFQENFPNAATWFLICLFEVNALFYIITLAARAAGRHTVTATMALSLLCGVAGMALSYRHVNLPCFIDTTLSATPYFAAGYFLNHHTRLMQPTWRYRRYEPLIMAACAALLFWLAYPVDFRSNTFTGAYFSSHIAGLSGTLLTLLIAKKVKTLPVITYWGRYSIMILLTHQIVYQLLHQALKHYFAPHGMPILAVNMTLTMALYLVLIPLMRRYVPHLTAQKDVIHVGVTHASAPVK